MQSTQRSEGMDSLVKMDVKRYSTLFESVCSLELVLKAQRNRQEELDHKDTPTLFITPLPIECSLLNVYTTEAFLLYQQVTTSTKEPLLLYSTEPTGYNLYSSNVLDEK